VKKAKHILKKYPLYTYIQATLKCEFQNDWGASMTECMPPSELA